MNHPNDQPHSCAVTTILVLLAAAFLVATGNTAAQEAAGARDIGEPQTQPPSFAPSRQPAYLGPATRPQTKPALPWNLETFHNDPPAAPWAQTRPAPWISNPSPSGPPRQRVKPYRWITVDGNTVLVPSEGREELDQAPPYRRHYMSPRARALKELSEGNPAAWATVLGIVGAMVLAFVVSLAFRGPRETDPDKIVAAWRKRQGLCMGAGFGGVPLAFVLAIVLAVALDSPFAFALGFCPVLFICLVISFAKWRCPACDAGMGHNWNPKFCPKCGVALQGPQTAAGSGDYTHERHD